MGLTTYKGYTIHDSPTGDAAVALNNDIKKSADDIETLNTGLTGLTTTTNAHIANVSNPHNVTIGQIGAAAAVHTHAASDITSGTIATARLGSGSASASTFLRGDQTWQNFASGITTTQLYNSGGLAISSGGQVQDSHATGTDLSVYAGGGDLYLSADGSVILDDAVTCNDDLTVVGTLHADASHLTHLPLPNYTYRIAQNVGGTVYTAYDATGAVVTSNSTPDIAPILNTLLANLVAAGGGRIFIANGQYSLIGSWTEDTNTSAGNHHVYYNVGIPVPSSAKAFHNIHIEGESGGAIGENYGYITGIGTQALTSVGVQIVTNFSALQASGGGTIYNSVFYALFNPTANAFSNEVQLSMNNIRFTMGNPALTAANSKFVMIDMLNASGFFGGTLVVDLAAANISHAVFTGEESWGVWFPNGQNQGPCTWAQIYVAGFNHGVNISDHANISYLYVQNAQFALDIGNSSHPAVVHMFNPQECQFLISLTANTDNSLIIHCLDPEVHTGLSSNQGRSYSALFANSFEPFYGEINWAPFDELPPNGFGALPAGGYSLRYIGQNTTTLNGTTAGTASWNMPEMGSNYKKFFVILNGYKNAGGASQTITFPVAFTVANKLTADDSGGASVNLTTLTLPNSMGTTKTGIIVVEGM